MYVYIVFLEDQEQYRFDFVEDSKKYEKEIAMIYPNHGDFEKIVLNSKVYLSEMFPLKTFHESFDTQGVFEDIQKVDKIIQKYNNVKEDFLLQQLNDKGGFRFHPQKQALKEVEITTTQMNQPTRDDPITNSNHCLRQEPQLSSMWNIYPKLKDIFVEPGTSTIDPQPYEGKVLYDNPSRIGFGSAYIESENDSEEDEDQIFYVYYNSEFQCVHCFTKEHDFSLEEIEYVQQIDEDVVEYIKDMNFKNVEQLKSYLRHLVPSTVSNEKISKCINKLYEITEDLEDRMKFSELYNVLLKEMKVEQDDDKKLLKNLLPKCLKDMELEKKRYSDGQYWYGLKKIVKTDKVVEILEKNVEEAFERIKEERKNEVIEI